MSINRCVDNTFTFKNYQRLEVNKTINGKFYQFCHSMEVGENYMIYSTHNPNAGKDWQKRYKHLEIYSNNVNPFQDSPPGIGSSWKIEKQNNNYY